MFLSDDQIVEILTGYGIEIAVARWRSIAESLNSRRASRAAGSPRQRLSAYSAASAAVFEHFVEIGRKAHAACDGAARRMGRVRTLNPWDSKSRCPDRSCREFPRRFSSAQFRGSAPWPIRRAGSAVMLLHEPCGSIQCTPILVN